jgi:hypothetical protein
MEGLSMKSLDSIRAEFTRRGGPVHEEWRRWLDAVPWSYFLTLTYNDDPPPHPHTALRHGTGFARRAEQMLPFEPPYVVVVEGAAWGPVRTHIHSLIAGVSHLRYLRSELKRCWQRGHCRIAPAEEAAVWYVTKDLPKGVPFERAPRFWSRVHGVNRFEPRVATR